MKTVIFLFCITTDNNRNHMNILYKWTRTCWCFIDDSCASCVLC